MGSVHGNHMRRSSLPDKGSLAGLGQAKNGSFWETVEILRDTYCFHRRVSALATHTSYLSFLVHHRICTWCFSWHIEKADIGSLSLG